MKFPLIVVNFKLYEQGTGDGAIKLAKICEKVSDESGFNIVVVVNSIDLEDVVNAVNIPVFVQHVDPVSYGSHTGQISPELVFSAGAKGVLLNHNEDRIDDEVLKITIKKSQEAGLVTLVCLEGIESFEKFKNMNADLYALEPKELIGGAESVSTAACSVIENAVIVFENGKLIVGGGIKSADDVKVALALGAYGVFVASAIVRSKDPYSALLRLVSGLKV